ncbi:hypothetical protein D3C80_1672670 [compost metagenome]
MCCLADSKIARLPVIGDKGSADVIVQLELFRQLEGKGVSGAVAVSVGKSPRIVQRHIRVHIIDAVRNGTSVRSVNGHGHTGNDVRLMFDRFCLNLCNKPDSISVLHKQH